MTPEELRAVIARGESLTTEFKSDRGPLSDAELLETVVCLTNAQGGILLVGVEDGGTVTGLHQRHRQAPHGLASFIASRTKPPLNVQIAIVTLPEGPVAAIEVPPASQTVATSDGKQLIRYQDSHGRPGCRPLYPYEQPAWYANRGQRDYTAQPLMDAAWDALDPLEFERLRRLVWEYHGDDTLLTLNDEHLARALGPV